MRTICSVFHGFPSLIITLLVVIVSLSICSCSNYLELSCNKDINLWATENLKTFESGDCEQIVSMPMDKQRAIYRGLSGQKKVALWKRKFNKEISSGVLTQNEIDHYSRLIDFLRPYHFETSAGKRDLDTFAKEWEMSARELFGWGDNEIFIYACCWLTDQELSDAILLQLDESNQDRSIDPIKDCDCYYDIYCIKSFQGVCMKKNVRCEEKDGCGLLGNSNCTGLCE